MVVDADTTEKTMEVLTNNRIKILESVCLTHAMSFDVHQDFLPL